MKKLNCLGIARRVILVKGAAEGKTKLNAFDNALIKAGINDYNLIKVSSILSKGTKLEKSTILCQVEKGSFVPCVLSEIYGSKNEQISAGIAIAFSKNGIGFVVEEGGKNISKENLATSLTSKITEMATKRKTTILGGIQYKLISHRSKQISCAIAALVYIF